MAFVSLYRKYRPQTFNEILGQEHVSRTLANAITEGRVAHAFLFTGPRGTGKTSTARILAKALNCVKGPTPEPCGICESCRSIAEGSSLDVFEMDAASHSGVDETREILAGVPLATAGGRKKVYVIDEVHMLTTQSFNALLKTLEEPPDHVVFVLATTEAHKVLPTIVSRTQRFDFRRIPSNLLDDHLADVAKREEIEIDRDAIGAIARYSDGGARDALSALDQLASLGGPIRVGDVENLLGERDEDALFRLHDAVSEGNVGGVFTILDGIISQGADVRQVALGTMQHARSLLLLKTSPSAEQLLDAPDEDRQRLAEQAERFRIGGLLRLLDLVGKAVTEMRNAPNHRLFLEVALARAAAPETDTAPEAVLGRIERLERRFGIEGPAPAASQDAPDAPGALRTDPPHEPATSPPKAAARIQEAEERSQEPAVRRERAKGPSGEGAPQPRQQPPDEPAAANEPAPKPASDPDHIGLSHIRDAWQPALKEVSKRSKRVGAYLNPSAPVAYDDEGLVVEVQSSFHASSMSKEPNRKVLGESLHAVLGVSPTLRFAERGADPIPPEDDGGVYGSGDAHYAETSEATEDHDPVELIKRGFDAEVVKEIQGGNEL